MSNQKQVSAVTLQIAEALHKEYRAAVKALHTGRLRPGHVGTSRNCIEEHDHGWSNCHRKQYFIRRALRGHIALIEVAPVAAQNAGKCSKCKHDAHSANDCNEKVNDAAGDTDWCPCGVDSRTDAERKAARDKQVRAVLNGGRA